MPTNKPEYSKKYYQEHRDKFKKKQYKYILNVNGQILIFDKKKDILKLVEKRNILKNPIIEDKNSIKTDK